MKMKNINDILNESLLDDEDKILKDAEKNVYIKKIRNIFDKANNDLSNISEAKDYFRRDINIGDLILYVPGSLDFDAHIVKEIIKNSAGDYYMVLDNGDRKFCFECILIPKNRLKDFLNIIS